MYCDKCGQQVPDNAVACPNCGASIGNGSNVNDIPSTGINILACCFPIVGLILYLVWRDQTPLRAKSVGKWALIGVAIGVVAWILYIVLIMVGLFSVGSYSSLWIARPF